jgi:hypothetical protein
VGDADAGEHLRQLRAEVELLLPEGPQAHPQQAEDAARPEDPLPHVRLAAVEETVGLPVRPADDLDRPRPDGRDELGEGLGVVAREAFVADGVEVDVPLHARLAAEAEHVADAAGEDVIPHSQVMSTQCMWLPKV